MKKRQRTLLLLLLALAALLGAWLLLRALAPKEEAAGAAPVIPAVAEADVDTLTWTNEGEEITLRRTESGWAYAADPDFPLDQAAAAALADAATSLIPTACVPAAEAASPEDYGLDFPLRSVTVTGKDGALYAYTVGTQSPVSSNEYYVSVNDTGDVYLLPDTFYKNFEKGLYDLLAEEEIPALTGVKSLTVKTQAGTLTLARTEAAGEASGSTVSVWTAETEAGPVVLDTDKATALLQSLTGLVWTGCVHYKASDALLAEYGFAAPSASVAAVSQGADGADATFAVEFGGVNNGYAYARLAGSRMVYLTDETARTAFLEASVASLT